MTTPTTYQLATLAAIVMTSERGYGYTPESCVNAAIRLWAEANCAIKEFKDDFHDAQSQESSPAT